MSVKTSGAIIVSIPVLGSIITHEDTTIPLYSDILLVICVAPDLDQVKLGRICSWLFSTIDIDWSFNRNTTSEV